MMRTVIFGLIVAATAGCQSLVPVPVGSVNCKGIAATMTQNCAKPVEIPDGATYGMSLELWKRDRDSLDECGLRHSALSDSVKICLDEIDKYNAELKSLQQTRK
jgi:hypothetical protein